MPALVGAARALLGPSNPPPLPSGRVYLLNDDGSYRVDDDGAYLTTEL